VNRGKAGELAAFRRDHPGWKAWRQPDGSYLALRGTTLVAAWSLERLGLLISRAVPDRGAEDGKP
jgi:hypothetical protein